jgi:excisionase family DNA binding protein
MSTSLYLPTGQAVRHLKVGADTLRRWADEGRIRYERTASGRYLFDVIGFIANQAKRPEHVRYREKN